jgi:hypothetical protein
MFISITPCLISLLYLYLLYFKLNITIINNLSNNNKSLINKNNYNPILLLLLSFLLVFFIFFTPILSSTSYNVSNQTILYLITLSLLTPLLFSINRNKNIKECIVVIWFVLFSIFFSTIQNIFLMLFVAEILFYSFILLVITSIVRVNYIKSVEYFSSLIVIIVLNFLTTFGLYIYVSSYIYQYGFTQIINNQNSIESVLIFFIILKLSNGPWFLWNLNVYTRLSQFTITLYITVFFILQVPLYYKVIISSLYYFNFIWFFILLVLNLLVNFNIYNIINIKYFFLYSSYITYITLLLLLI